MTKTPEDIQSNVFNNAVILENILEYFSEDFRNHLNLRLINKSVNQVFMALIRSNHKITKIEVIEKRVSSLLKQPPSNWIYINYRIVNKSKVVGYFRFLNSIGVEIKEINTKNIFLLEEKLAKEVHDYIHCYLIGNKQESVRKLIGLEEFCRGCSKCVEMAKQCQEYGPISQQTLKNIREPTHFEELIIDDYLLDDIANYCSLNSGTLVEFLNNLRLSTNSNITCDKLVLSMDECKRYYIIEEAMFDNPRIPRQVLNSMLEMWRVKTIKLIFICPPRDVEYPDVNWHRSDFFTTMELKGLFTKNKKSEKKFEHVTVDFSDSYLCSRSFKHNCRFEKSDGYHNLIANIRRVFPCETIFLNFLPGEFTGYGDIMGGKEVVLKKLQTVVGLEKQENLTVNVTFFTRAKSFLFENWETGMTELPEIPSEFSIRKYKISRFMKYLPFGWKEGLEKFENERWIGRRLNMEDSRNKLRINVDFFIMEKEWNFNVSRDLLDLHPNALVKHFMDSFS